MSSPETVSVADDSGSELYLNVVKAIATHIHGIGTLPDGMTMTVSKVLRNGTPWSAGKTAFRALLTNGPITMDDLVFRGLSRIEFQVTEAT
jgi:hypothetical protein